jgi:AmmeMemoRadiSam system protein A
MIRKMKWLLVALVIAAVASVAVIGVKQSPSHGGRGAKTQGPQRVREPAVAGLFYPKDAAELAQTVDALLAQARTHTIEGKLRALICPHAGCSYSGPVAATAYRLLPGREFRTVFVIAASHYAPFRGASVANADAYRTPLGLVPIAPAAAELAKTAPFVLEPRCILQRPQWAAQASRPMPGLGEDTPETWEHSGEVQVPFLQRTLKDFSLVSIVTGDVDPAQMAQALLPRLDDKTLLVISTDLSHYHPYDKAKELDGHCVQAMCRLNIERMQSEEACGKAPVLAVMHLARQKGWKPKLLDYRNSGDTAGNKDGVVGYAAIAFYEPAPQSFSTEERKYLLSLARQSLKEAATNNRLPDVKSDGLAAKFAETKGCFVTLTKGGQLRGCIGHIIPQQPLFKAIIENAQSAALRDTRFAPVQPSELDQIEVEVSVLTVPQPLAFSSPEDLLGKLQPHKDGVVLQIGHAGATYLPQVWEQIPDKVDFMNSLSQKAGLPPDTWRKGGAAVFIYHVESFKESEL